MDDRPLPDNIFRCSTRSTPRNIRKSSADRFIPTVARAESLFFGRCPTRLTQREKLVRTLNAGTDPFSSTIPRTPMTRRVGSSPPDPSNSVSRVVSVGQTTTSLRASPRGTLVTRRTSEGTVWGLGGRHALGDNVVGVTNGRGGLLASGTNAPLYSSNFLSRKDSSAELDVHERRIALALDLDIASRVFQYSVPVTPDSGYASSSSRRNTLPDAIQRLWRDNEWQNLGKSTPSKKARRKKAVPIIPFRYALEFVYPTLTDNIVTVLDAPALRDDYYCSLLAYSPSIEVLAVGLGSHVYLWSESRASAIPESLQTSHTAHITSLSFSSTSGNRGILAVGRADGRILLWSPKDSEARWDALQPNPICCVAFRPQPVKRLSARDRYVEVYTEELLVGDEAGHLYYYSVEWPTEDEKALYAWPGAMSLHFRTVAHTQQICGIAWSPEGDWFATGGNDNICYLYSSIKVLQHAEAAAKGTPQDYLLNLGSSSRVDMSSEPFMLGESIAKHRWILQAAVKAIAFCPWQRGLIAIGGGSNDRCIHFYHSLSGSCIATIDCWAQVTSLIWSTTRREIAATFGFAQPEHPYRIAVFAWPSCKQIVAIPWYDEHRALYAVPYPGGPNVGEASKGEGGAWWSRTREEGCIVVATSDCSIKFHEVWAEERKATASKGGLLGGSDILESLHGIVKDGGEVIR